MLSRGLRALDLWSEQLPLLWHLIFWPVCYGVLLGASVWWGAHPEHASGLGGNRVPFALRVQTLYWALGGGLGALLVQFGWIYVVRRRTGTWQWREVAGRFRRAACLCLAAPLLIFLDRDGAEKSYPNLTAASSIAVGTLVAFTLYGVLPRRVLRWTGRWVHAGAAMVLLIMAGTYSWFFSRLAITNHHALGTWTFDLALYDNIFYQSLHGNLLGCSFLQTGYHGSAHFDPILILLSPIYLIYPHAESILVLQCLWVASGVWPLYLLSRQRLFGPLLSLALPAMWLLHPALQGANMFDFHSLTLIAPLVLWLYYFFERRSSVGYFVTFTLLLLVREDVPLLLCFLGWYGLLLKDKWTVRVGWLTIGIGLVYFVIAKAFFMVAPTQVLSGTPSYSFSFYYGELIPYHGGLREMALSLLTNPSFVLKLVLTQEKLLFLALVFAPLGLLPLFVRHGRLVFVYGVVFCLLATRTAVFSIYFQYVCLLFAPGFALAATGLVRLSQGPLLSWVRFEPLRFRRAFLAGCVVGSALICWKFGGVVENQVFHGGFARPVRTLTEEHKKRYQWVQDAVALIPPDASVAATRQLGPHISNRRRAYLYPTNVQVDYLLLDLAQLSQKELAFHRTYSREGKFKQVKRMQKLILLQRQAASPKEAKPR